MKKILIVDDQAFNHILIKELLESEYEFLDANDGYEALEIIEKRHDEISLILLDLQMEGISGFDVLAKLNETGYIKRNPVIVITGDNNESVEVKSLEMHASDFLFKPFSATVLRQRIKNVIQLNDYQVKLEEKVLEQTQKIRKFNNSLLDLLGILVEFRDLESGNHVFRVKNYTHVLAKKLQTRYLEYNLTDKLIEDISNASVLHDLGKIAIPDNILLKPGRLTAEEFEIMKTHTTRGSDLIMQINDIMELDFFKLAFEITRHHHERFDGRGYPDHLVGDAIPISAQLVSVADVFDALVSDRVYKKAVEPEKARDMILNNECGVFSEKLMECFKECFEEFKEISIKLR